MPLIEYPTDFSEALSTVIAKIRGEAVPTNKLIRCAYHTLGFVLGKVTPDSSLFATTGSIDLTPEQVASYLEDVLDETGSEGVKSIKSLPWKIIAAALTKLLVKWIMEQEVLG
jgi:hypothetical protein